LKSTSPKEAEGNEPKTKEVQESRPKRKSLPNLKNPHKKREMCWGGGKRNNWRNSAAGGGGKAFLPETSFWESDLGREETNTNKRGNLLGGEKA